MDDSKKDLDAPHEGTFKGITKGYTFKVILLVALVLLLMIPLSMLRTLVNERGKTARNAESDIMEAWGKELLEAGPVIAIPGIETQEIRTQTEKEGEKIQILQQPFTLIIAPKQLAIDARFSTEIRRRGIFSVPLFSGELLLSGSFDPAVAMSELKPNQSLALGEAEIIISLSSQKGIRKINTARWDGEDLFFRPGTRSHSLIAYTANGDRSATPNSGASGIYALLPLLEDRESSFIINFTIQGGQMVQFLPIGQDTKVTIETDWTSPSFQGAFLPGTSTVTDRGFSAEWEISYLSRDIPLFWIDRGDTPPFSASLFGVSFFRTINTYSLNTRAVKYAILFLIVPFLTIFLLEILTKQRVHPAQYLLSAIGNSIFYLLLLSLSEQIPFYAAYLISALAVTAMMTLYSRSFLPSWGKSASVALVMALSYILLYAVLNAESYALLIGSIGTFAVTALIMFVTRKLNWYGRSGLNS
jgi:inner membrane protein